MKNATAQAVTLTRLDALARATVQRRVPFVAAYHRVVDRLNASAPFALPAMETSASMLERHLDWMGKHFDFVSVDELATRRRSRPVAAITFDDGYADVYEHAFPILKRKGIPAALFVVTDIVGTSALPIHERLHAALLDFSATQRLLSNHSASEVEQIIHDLDPDRGTRRFLTSLRPLTWEMLAEMRDAGMTIGSHSLTHAFLRNESAVRVREEVVASRHQLQKRLGIDAGCFAYPGGSFTSEVVDAVAAAGYRFGFTICRHRDRRHPALTIPRTGLWEQSCLGLSGRFSQAVMSAHTAGTFRLMSRCKQPHRRTL